MRGLGGITDAINSLLGSAGIEVQPWFFPAILLLGFSALVPHIRQNQRTQQAREKIREVAEDGGAANDQLHEQILTLAHGHPTTLLVITTEAQKRGLLVLAKRAFTLLEQTGKHRPDVRRLRNLLMGPPPLHPEAENAAIEKLLDQGLIGMARTRLDRARTNWPHHPDWDQWEAKLSVEE